MNTDPHVLLVHGLGDHARALSLEHCQRALEAVGLRTASFDLPGHGERAQRGLAVRWSDCRDELSRVRRGLSGRPLVLVGLSLGGLLALQHALDEPAGLAGVVAVAPALDPHGSPWLVRKLVPWLARWVPRLRIDPRLDLTAISRDLDLARRCVADPLAQTTFPVSLLAGVLAAIAECQARATELTVPTLLLQGAADRIVPPDGARRFAARASRAVECRVYPGALHNLFVETNRAEVFADIVAWLARLSPSTSETAVSAGERPPSAFLSPPCFSDGHRGGSV